ncbi:MAG: hypothetical protein V1929_12575 [bacterium]
MEKLTRMFAFVVVATTLALGTTGCDYNDDNNNDHEPPPGQGSLIIYNNTVDDIAVFIDGIRVDDVGDYNDRAYDLETGVHRVILDQRGGDRTFADDVDILADRRTIMDVATDPVDTLDYDVVIFFD